MCVKEKLFLIDSPREEEEEEEEEEGEKRPLTGGGVVLEKVCSIYTLANRYHRVFHSK